jgi:Arc/MetJ-type ribon-helix-helix transcriptional regulator
MTIQLNPEQEQLLSEAIRAGLISSGEDVVAAGVEAIRQRLDAREWLREFRAWVQSHSTTTPLLSDEAISRDSFYANRGL